MMDIETKVVDVLPIVGCPTCEETHKAIAELQASHNELIALVNAIKEQVEPTIQSLASSPMFRLLGGK